MRRKYLIAAVAVLLLIAGSVFGFRYVTHDMPQVSSAETIDALEDYRAGLESCYLELNNGFDENGSDTQAWAEFSETWFKKLSDSKPEALDKRTPADQNGEKEDLMFVNRKIINLWQEYNLVAEGSTINQKEVDEIKTMMDDYFNEYKK